MPGPLRNPGQENSIKRDMLWRSARRAALIVFRGIFVASGDGRLRGAGCPFRPTGAGSAPLRPDGLPGHELRFKTLDPKIKIAV